MENLSDRIKKKRFNLKKKQNDIAASCGVSGVAVVKWESGQSEPKGENLYKLARALQTTPEYLLYGFETPGEKPKDFCYPLVKIEEIASFYEKGFPRVNADFLAKKIYGEKTFGLTLSIDAFVKLSDSVLPMIEAVSLTIDPDALIENGSAALILYKNVPLIRTFFNNGAEEWHPVRESRFPVISNSDVKIIGRICEMGFETR